LTLVAAAAINAKNKYIWPLYFRQRAFGDLDRSPHISRVSFAGSGRYYPQPHGGRGQYASNSYEAKGDKGNTLREKLFGRSRLLPPSHPVGAYRPPATCNSKSS
jgi:hypothetical protein